MRGILQTFRPTLGLSLDHEAARLVRVTRTWRRTLSGTRTLGEAPLPPGALAPSATRPNIAVPESVRQAIRDLRPRGRGLLPVALSLPDLCGYATVFELATLPPRRADQEALIHWRAKTELGIPVDQARLAYRFYRSGSQGDAARNGQAVWALVGVLQRDIVEQYEGVCLEAGLLPVSTGLASLSLFDLVQERLETIPVSTPAMIKGDTEAPTSFLAHLAPWGLMIMVREPHHPTFLRMKAINGQGRAEERMDQVESRHQEVIPVVTRELVSTIQYYRRLRAKAGHGHRASLVYLFTTRTDGSPGADPGEDLPGHLEMGPSERDAVRLLPVPAHQLWPDPRPSVVSSVYLCALAGVRAA